MRTRRLILRLVLLLLVVALLAGSLLYGLASRVPAEYRRARRRAVSTAVGKRDFGEVASEFFRVAGAGRPFTWSVTADEVNYYLASADELASYGTAEPVSPLRRLERSGFAGPAVAMDDGVLTLMIESREHHKVLSVDLAFVFEKDGRVRAEIRAARVGAAPVPERLIRGQVAELRRRLTAMLSDVQDDAAALDPASATAVRVLRGVVAMLDGEAVRPGFVWDDGAAEHPLLVTGIHIDDGRLTVHLTPDP
jgi:hypothetical protein